MKVYGADICIDCRNFKVINENRGLGWEYIDITADTPTLKEFLVLRDTRPEMEEVRAEGGIGIPLFTDGERYALDMDDALAWLGLPPVEDSEIAEWRD